MFLLDRLLLGAPIAGLKFVLRTIGNVADAELADDEQKVIAEVRVLHERFESGEVDEAEFRRQEAPLLERWRVLRRHALGLE